jgi:Flp pilus assembly protein TadD
MAEMKPQPAEHHRLLATLAAACLAWALSGAPVRAATAVAAAAELAEVRAMAARGELPAALQRAQKAASADPRDAQARFLVGVLMMDLQHDDEALTHFARMAQDYPELPDPLNNMALLQARAGHLELARQSLEAALRNDPAHRTARGNLGQVYLMLAAQTWERVAASAPLDPAVQRRLEGVRALLAQGAAIAR